MMYHSRYSIQRWTGIVQGIPMVFDRYIIKGTVHSNAIYLGGTGTFSFGSEMEYRSNALRRMCYIGHMLKCEAQGSWRATSQKECG